jgi:tetratricopeptide (TPR) repeat protein
MQGHTDEAVAQFRDLLQIDPNSAEGHGMLSRALILKGQTDEALEHAQRAVELSRKTDDSGHGHNNAMMLRILGAAYAKAGRYPEAVAAAKMGVERAQSQRDAALAEAIGKDLGLYEANAKGMQ